MTFASFIPLLPVALLMAFLQAPAPSNMRPSLPAPGQDNTPAAPDMRTPPTPKATAETLTPKDPAAMVPLLDALIKAQDTKSSQQTFIDQANKQLQRFGAEMQQDDVAVQAAIDKVKKENGWGAEVQFDRGTRKFEKVETDTRHAATAKPAGKTK